MVFTAKVEFYEECEGKVRTHNLFITGENYAEALQKMINYYSEAAIESFTLAEFAPEEFVIFEEKDEELFKTVKKTLGEEVLWQFQDNEQIYGSAAV